MTQGNSVFNQWDAEAFIVAAAGFTSFVFYIMQAYTWQFLLSLVIYAFVTLRLVKKLGALDARVLFFAISGVYSTAGSVDYYLFEDSGGYGEAQNATILVIGLGFMIAAGAFLLARARDSDHVSPLQLKCSSLHLLGVVATALLAIYVGLSVRKFGLGTGDFDRATLTSEQGTVAALARNLLVALILTWTWASGYLRGQLILKLLLPCVVVSLVFFDLLYLGDRRIILCMLLGIAYLKLNRSQLLLLATPLISIALLGLIVFAALREQPFDMWIDIVAELDLRSFLTPVNLDCGGFPLIASDALASSRLLLSDAPNYFQGLLATIPSGLYENRPEAFSVWYVKTYHPDVAAIGAGLASNWIIESYVNLGVLGPLVVGLFTAGLLNRICSISQSLTRLSCAASIPAFAFLMRYDLTSFVQVFCVVTVVAIGLGWQIIRFADKIVLPEQGSGLF
jgi:hypothetical protein